MKAEGKMQGEKGNLNELNGRAAMRSERGADIWEGRLPSPYPLYTTAENRGGRRDQSK